MDTSIINVQFDTPVCNQSNPIIPTYTPTEDLSTRLNSNKTQWDTASIGAFTVRQIISCPLKQWAFSDTIFAYI